MDTLKTERLNLREALESDAAAIWEYSRSPEVGTAAGWKPHESLEETRQIMKEIFLDQESVWMITLSDSGVLIGSIGLIPDPKRQNVQARMLGYSIGKPWWGRGYATEAAKAVIEYGFTRMDLSLISAYCYPGNKRSQSVIKKCGFQYEGCLQMTEIRWDGVLLDENCYALVRPKETV